MSIRIGNNNKFKKSTIGHQYNSSKEKKKFHEKHPVLFNASIALFIGFILLFSFWTNIIHWIESLFQ